MSKKQTADITVEKFQEQVNKQIAKIEAKIDRTYERYPQDGYGLKAETMVDPMRDDIRRLKDLAKGVKDAAYLRVELERTKTEKGQIGNALADALQALGQYDPHQVEIIRRRWKV